MATPITTTTAGSMSLATMAPLIDWALNGCPRPAPATTSLAIAALLVPLVHLVYLWFTRRAGVSDGPDDPPAASAVPQTERTPL